MSEQPEKDQSKTAGDDTRDSGDREPRAGEHPEEVAEVANEERYRRAERRHWVALFLTFIAAAGAIGSAIAAFRALEATTQTASAALEANRINSDTARRQLRAYLVVETYGALGLDSSGIPTAVFLVVNNVGQTPASHVTQTLRGSIFQYPLPNDFRFPALQGSDFYGIGVIIPAAVAKDSSITRALITPLMTKEDWDMAKLSGTKSKRLYVFGVTTYHDIFEIERHTRFCFSLSQYGGARSLWETCQGRDSEGRPSNSFD